MIVLLDKDEDVTGEEADDNTPVKQTQLPSPPNEASLPYAAEKNARNQMHPLLMLNLNALSVKDCRINISLVTFAMSVIFVCHALLSDGKIEDWR